MGTVDGDDVATLDPQASTNEIVVTLAREGFTPNWLLSYEYGGEVANLVRFHYDPDLFPERPFRQLHSLLQIPPLSPRTNLQTAATSIESRRKWQLVCNRGSNPTADFSRNRTNESSREASRSIAIRKRDHSRAESWLKRLRSESDVPVIVRKSYIIV